MIRNYLRIAWRNLVRRKSYTALNIAGLVVGIAAAVLLYTVVRAELGYESFRPHADRIFHVVTEDEQGGETSFTPGIPYPALDALRLDFPSVPIGALFSNFGSQVTVLGKEDNAMASDKKFIEPSGVFYADPQFFRIFSTKWLAGTPDVLAEPNTTVLSRKMAEKYFGDWKTAVGQYLKLDNAIVSRVAGVMENPPGNTDFPLHVVSSFESMKAHPALYGYTTDWGSTTSNFQLFMLLPDRVSEGQVNRQLLAFGKKHYEQATSKRRNFLQPLRSVHFDTRFGNFGDHVTSRSTLWTLTLIGIFIIVMACINFINLSTALAVGRSKEVGVRKVLGSNRNELFWQVLGETGILVLFSVLMALLLAWLVLPLVKHVASIPDDLRFFNLPLIGFALIVWLLVSFLSGIYPSWVVSRFNPSLALKNKITSATVGGISLRRVLVVLQFAISQVLVVGTLVAIGQMNFVRNADLGFNREAVLVLSSNADSAIVSRQEAMKQKLLDLPGVQSVSFSTDVPSSDNNWSTNFAYEHKPDENFGLFLKYGDEDYFNTYGLRLIAGRTFAKSDTTREVVVNETLLHKLGVKDAAQALGKEIRTGRSPWRRIVGVVRDFKTNSLREEVKPLMIGERRRYYGTTGIKLRTRNLSEVQESVQRIWNEFNPEYAYTASFLEENINNFYRQEEQLSLLYKIFTGIALFISCLGLYGLVSFMAAQRKKEVGIRKVLGASAAHIIYLFSREFTLLILLAFVISVPVAWYFMNQWLQNFVFRISLGPWIFLLTVFSSILIAWLTVGYKSLKAARANPVKNLRSE